MHGGQVTWGSMLFWAQNTSALIRGAWWTFVVPGMAIALTAFSLALINNAVDELGNPRLRADRLLTQARLVQGGRAFSPFFHRTLFSHHWRPRQAACPHAARSRRYAAKNAILSHGFHGMANELCLSSGTRARPRR